MSTFRLNQWLEGYLDYVRDVKRLSPGTIRDKRCTFKKISLFMEKYRPEMPLWKVTLEDYLAYLNVEREKGMNESVLAKDISHIRGMLDYAWRSGQADRNVLDGFSMKDRVQKIPPRVLTLDEARRLVSVFDKRDRSSRRYRVVILLLYGCGLRTFEFCNLNIPDVDIEKQEIFIRHGKGDKQRRVPVPGAVWTELMAYLAERGGKRGPLFRTEVKRKRIRDVDVGAIVRAAAKRAGIDWKVTPRTLRHTFGTHLMDSGVDVSVIASLMGHSTPNETGVYLHVLPGVKEAAVKNLEKGADK